MRALAGGGWAGALGVLTLVSCGGRTSALDSDVYGSSADGVGDGDEAGSSNGGSSGGGRPGVGGAPIVGGTGASVSGAPVGGTSVGGMPGVNPSLSLAPCSAYCPGYGTQCAARLMGQDCMTACQAEVNSFGQKCQTLGINALKCLTPFFTPNGSNCDAAVNAALTKCGKVVSDFQTCKGNQTPTMPTMPTMPTTPDVTSCGGMGFTDTSSCVELYPCSAGVYTVICSYSPMSTTAECSCSRPTGETVGTTFPNDGKACYRAATTLCK